MNIQNKYRLLYTGFCLIIALVLWEFFINVRLLIGQPAIEGPQVRNTLVTPRISNALMQGIQKDRAGKVIVGLKDIAQPLIRLRGADAKNPIKIQARRTAIRQLQDRVLNRIAEQSQRRFGRFKDIPYIVVEVDLDGLNTLVQLPEVASIQEDRLRQASLIESIPIIGADLAWNAGNKGNGQTIAILDSGVDSNHPFLANAVVWEGCYSSTYDPHSATSLCPDGSEDLVNEEGAATPCIHSGCDHGTHVAGIAAGSGGSFSGVAPESTIIAFQVFSKIDNSELCPSGLCAYDRDILAALEQVYQLRNTFDIVAVNMSLGGGVYDTAIG